MLRTAESHWARVWAPPPLGLYWRVLCPMPARFMTCATLTLQLRHVGPRFVGDPSDSSPLMWPTIKRTVAPHQRQCLPGGLHSTARCLSRQLLDTNRTIATCNRPGKHRSSKELTNHPPSLLPWPARSEERHIIDPHRGYRTARIKNEKEDDSFGFRRIATCSSLGLMVTGGCTEPRESTGLQIGRHCWRTGCMGDTSRLSGPSCIQVFFAARSMP